jgi:hypothetical protein
MINASVSIRPTTHFRPKGSALMDSPRPLQPTLAEFLQWREAGSLELSPKFQRKAVWSPTQRSYFIDTMLQQMPSPQIYLRKQYNLNGRKIVHEVIDGQQRLRSVLDFYDGKYAISSNLEESYAGMRFNGLSKKHQMSIMKYKFNCETFDNISDREVQDVFRRMNTYSSPLTKQELRHGRWFGHFSRTCETLARDKLDFWRSNRILSNVRIARMGDVLLTCSLLISQIDGMQDKSKSIDDFYENFDNRFPNRERHEKRFCAVIEEIIETIGEDLRDNQFRKPPLFYSLYVALYHRMYGVPKEKLRTPGRPMTDRDRGLLKDACMRLSEVLTKAQERQKLSAAALKRAQHLDYPPRYETFVKACLSQTDNIRPRRTRFETLYREAFL